MSRLLSPSAIRTHASHHVSALMVLMMWLKSVRNLSRSLGVTSPRVARLCFRPSCAEYASHNCCKTWSVIWWFLSDEAEEGVSGRRALFGGDLFPERGLDRGQGGFEGGSGVISSFVCCR